MPDPTLYLFDGWNLLHAGSFKEPTELIDRLASFVGMTGARGILVFDGTGPDERIGPLEIRFAEHADTLLERLAAEHRGVRVGLHRLVGQRDPRRVRVRRCGPSPRSGSWPTRRRRRTRRSVRSGSATAWTSGLARRSSDCAAGE